MPSTNFRVKHIRDEDPKVQLRAPTDAAITASAATAALSLDALVDAYWDNGALAHAGIGVQVVVTDADFADADETYTISVEVANDEVFTSPQVVAQLSISAAQDARLVLLDADELQQAYGATHIRLNAALAGTTPSLTYHAWMLHVPEAH